MKEQDKNLQEQLNEGEISNLSEKGFRVMIVKMIHDLRNRMEAWIKKIQGKFKKKTRRTKEQTNRDKQDSN